MLHTVTTLSLRVDRWLFLACGSKWRSCLKFQSFVFLLHFVSNLICPYDFYPCLNPLPSLCQKSESVSYESWIEWCCLSLLEEKDIQSVAAEDFYRVTGHVCARLAVMSGDFHARRYIKKFWVISFFTHGATVFNGPGPPRYRRFTISHRHTTFGITPLDEWSVRHRGLYLTAL
jgi:hypothetical protein